MRFHARFHAASSVGLLLTGHFQAVPGCKLMFLHGQPFSQRKNYEKDFLFFFETERKTSTSALPRELSILRVKILRFLRSAKDTTS